MADRTRAENLLGFVRGERELAVLEEMVIEVRTSPGRQEARFRSELPAVTATLADLAAGFVAVLPDPRKSRTWAFVMLGSDVDLPDPEGSPAAEALVEALWDVSIGETPSAEALAIIDGLAH